MNIKSLDELENKVQALITTLENVRRENDRLRQELMDKSSKNSAMESENNQLNRELDALKNTTVDHKTKIEMVTERIQGVLARLESVQ